MAESKKGTLERQLRNVRIRAGLNVLLRQTAIVLALAGVAAALAVAVERVFVVQVISSVSAISAGAVAVLLAAMLAALRIPNRMQVAVLIDGRLGAKERFSTALALTGSDDPFALAAEAEAHQAAKRLDVRGHFPVRPSLHWIGPAATWTIAAAVFFLMPALDVLGNQARNQAALQKAAALAEAKTEVEKAAAKVKAMVSQANAPQLAMELDKIGELSAEQKPADVRRQAIKKLGKLGDRLRELQKNQKNTGLGDARNMLKDLRGTPDAFDNKLNRALAQGDFAGAAKMIRDALDKLNSGKLSPADKEALGKQLSDLAEQASKIGDPDKQVADMLGRQGMDSATAKKLAGMSEQDVRNALKEQGLSDEQIDKMMEKMSQCRNGAQTCQKIAQQLGECNLPGSGINPNGLIALSDSLDDLGQQQAGEMSLADALSEMEGAIARLGEGDCKGAMGGIGEGEGDPNGAGIWVPSDAEGQGIGAGGGRARAWGSRATANPEEVGLKGTGVRNKPTKDNEIIGSWLVKGQQVRGESKRKLTTAVQASKDAAAEAIRESKIPRKYEGPVKKYFGGMESAADPNSP